MEKEKSPRFNAKNVGKTFLIAAPGIGVAVLGAQIGATTGAAALGSLGFLGGIFGGPLAPIAMPVAMILCGVIGAAAGALVGVAAGLVVYGIGLALHHGVKGIVGKDKQAGHEQLDIKGRTDHFVEKEKLVYAIIRRLLATEKVKHLNPDTTDNTAQTLITHSPGGDKKTHIRKIMMNRLTQGGKAPAKAEKQLIRKEIKNFKSSGPYRAVLSGRYDDTQMDTINEKHQTLGVVPRRKDELATAKTDRDSARYMRHYVDQSYSFTQPIKSLRKLWFIVKILASGDTKKGFHKNTRGNRSDYSALQETLTEAQQRRQDPSQHTEQEEGVSSEPAQQTTTAQTQPAQQTTTPAPTPTKAQIIRDHIYTKAGGTTGDLNRNLLFATTNSRQEDVGKIVDHLRGYSKAELTAMSESLSSLDFS